MTTETPTRSSTGKFVKGQSGNPNGRPKKKDPILKSKCQDMDADILKMLHATIKNTKARPADRIKAADLVLSYGHGKPRQTVEQKVEIQDIPMPNLTIPDPASPLPDEDTVPPEEKVVDE